MNPSPTLAPPQTLWQALPVAHRQRLSTLLGQWVQRQWSAQTRPSPIATIQPGARHEPDRTENPT